MTVMPKGARQFTSREFNQNTGEAKQAAKEGPVFITDRGTPSHVLLTVEDYEKLADKTISLAEALEQKGGPEFDFDVELPPRSRQSSLRDPELR